MQPSSRYKQPLVLHPWGLHHFGFVERHETLYKNCRTYILYKNKSLNSPVRNSALNRGNCQVRSRIRDIVCLPSQAVATRCYNWIICKIRRWVNLHCGMQKTQNCCTLILTGTSETTFAGQTTYMYSHANKRETHRKDTHTTRALHPTLRIQPEALSCPPTPCWMACLSHAFHCRCRQITYHR